MDATLRLGAPGRRRAGVRRRALGVVAAWLALALGGAGPAAASVLYRCTGVGGETAYVSSTSGYRDCVKIGQWGSVAARPVRVAARTEPRPAKPAPPEVLHGPAPKPVAANPAVLRITPLATERVVATPAPDAAVTTFEPLPVVALDKLGSWVLPRVLGVPLAPTASGVPPPPAPERAHSTPASSAPASAAEIPLRVASAAEKPAPPRRGAVYRVVQKNGTVLYTNIASLAQGPRATTLFTYIVECYACDVHSKVNWATVPLHLAAFRDDVRSAVRLTGVDAALLRAVIHAESGFNPRALSYKGAQGLMQLMPATAFELGVGNAFDPAENISGGARYLATLLRAYHGDVELAAAAYNAGAGAVAKYGGVPPYAETQVYVKRVALLYQRYRKALAAAAPTLAAVRVD